ncbi:MAG: hypothetical protein CL916_08530 [Deltaproteobacteria bacterium]|nr:hypothetical protein [Deltaproteobacteria bacterium]
MSEENDKPVLNDPFLDEEEEDVILKTQMKIYDLFMGNWQKLLYVLGAFLLGTLVYGLYESSQEETLRSNSSLLAKASESLSEKNNTLANFISLDADFRRAVDQVEESQTDPNKIMESIQLQMKAREMNEELYFARTLFFSIDAVFPSASFVKPYPFDRASFYATSELGNALNNEELSLMRISALREIAVSLSDTVEKLEGETKVFGYLKLGQIWRTVKELDASINAFETAKTLPLTPTQKWLVASQLSQVYLEKGEKEKGISVLQEFTQSNDKQDFFVEYGHLHLAILQDSLGDKESAKNTLSNITPTRFVEEYQLLLDRL